MPEGHTLHRLARDLTSTFGGRTVTASSPQGRFAGGAALLDGRVLLEADAWGKHLFVDFAEADRRLHVHLGLYGAWPIAAGPAPAPVGAVRLRFVGGDGSSYADLRGPTACDLLTPAETRRILDGLGPDPLRDGADPERAWDRIRRSRAPLATLLMDQSVIAGIGNVYRAEILFRHRLHPLRPGTSLTRPRFEAVWGDLVALMTDGMREGRIRTLRESDRPHPADSGGRAGPGAGWRDADVYVYRRAGEACRVCGRPIRHEVVGGRNLFWCQGCQPPIRPRSLR